MIRSSSLRPILALTGVLALGLAGAAFAQDQDAPEAASEGAHRIIVPQASAQPSDTAERTPPTPPVAEVPPGLGLLDMVAPVGAELSVAISANAPRDPADRIRIALPGSGPDDISGGEALVPVEGPAALRAPVATGAWELRYVTQGDGGAQVLETRVLTVVAEDYKSPRNRAEARP